MGLSLSGPSLGLGLSNSIRGALGLPGASYFHPWELFGNNEQGAWYDPSDFERYMAGKGPELAVASSSGPVVYDAATKTATFQHTAYPALTYSAAVKGRWYVIEGVAEGASNVFKLSCNFTSVYPVVTTRDGVFSVPIFFPENANQFVLWVEGYGAGITGSTVIRNLSVRELTAISTATLFQDSAGTTPVTAMEQPVGLMLDKRLGLVRGVELHPVLTATIAASGTSVASAGGVTFTAAAAGDGCSYAPLSSIKGVGTVHEVSITIDNYVSGSVALLIWGNTGNYSTTANVSANGTFTFRPTMQALGSANQTLRIQAGAAGTSLRVTAISVREIPGNHASQTTTTARPLLSARKNLLTYTATGLSAGSTNWGGSNNTGTLQADGSSLITRTSTTAGCFSQYLGGGISIPVGAQATGRIKVKKGSVGNLYGLRLQGTYPDRADCVINLDTGAITALAGNAFTGVSGAVSGPDVEGFYTITVTTTVAGSALTGFIHGPAAFFTGGWEAASTQLSNAYAKEPQLEYGPSATRYQRVNTATDYDWVGFPIYLKFDGVDDCLAFTPVSTVELDSSVVMSWAALVASPTTLTMGNTGTSALYTFYTASGKPRAYTRQGDSLNTRLVVNATAIPLGVPCVASMSQSPAAMVLRTNGTGELSSTVTQPAPTSTMNTALFGTNLTKTSFGAMQLYGAIIREGIANDIQGQERTLAGKAGVTL